MKKKVLILNIFGLNWLSRFITGHIGTGIIILLLDITIIAVFLFLLSYYMLFGLSFSDSLVITIHSLLTNIIGRIGYIIIFSIKIIDIINVFKNKWTNKGLFLIEWTGNGTEIIIIDGKKCQFCGKELRKGTIICNFCNKELYPKSIINSLEKNTYNNPYFTIKSTIVREQPDINAKKIIEIKKDELVDSISEAYEDKTVNDIWYKIKYNENTGWCLKASIDKFN